MQKYKCFKLIDSKWVEQPDVSGKTREEAKSKIPNVTKESLENGGTWKLRAIE